MRVANRSEKRSGVNSSDSTHQWVGFDMASFGHGINNVQTRGIVETSGFTRDICQKCQKVFSPKGVPRIFDAFLTQF